MNTSRGGLLAGSTNREVGMVKLANSTIEATAAPTPTPTETPPVTRTQPRADDTMGPGGSTPSQTTAGRGPGFGVGAVLVAIIALIVAGGLRIGKQ